MRLVITNDGFTKINWYNYKNSNCVILSCNCHSERVSTVIIVALLWQWRFLRNDKSVDALWDYWITKAGFATINWYNYKSYNSVILSCIFHSERVSTVMMVVLLWQSRFLRNDKSVDSWRIKNDKSTDDWGGYRTTKNGITTFNLYMKLIGTEWP